MATNEIPYKIYLTESEMPKYWYNLRADMKNKPAPLLNPGTHQPMTAEELNGVFCDELVRQELDNDTREYPVPQEILDRSEFLPELEGEQARVFDELWNRVRYDAK